MSGSTRELPFHRDDRGSRSGFVSRSTARWRRTRRGLAVIVVGVVALAAIVTSRTVVAEDVRVADRASLEEALRSARPGTTILLAPGDYDGGLRAERLAGKEGAPIVIRAADAESPPRIRGGRNALHLSDAVHVEIRDLVIEKCATNGMNVDDGGSFETPSAHVTFRGVTFRDIGSGGNHDGLKLSGVVDFRVEDCRFERWGRGGSGIDMVGCHRGVIDASTFREGDPQGANAVQMKGGSRDITVRRCRFEDAGGRGVNLGGSTGLPYFRPRPEGYEAKDLVVEDCVFVGGGAPVAFVGVDGATVRHNVIYHPGRWVLRILQETRGEDFVPSRNGRFESNIVVYRSSDVRTLVNIGDGTDPASFRFSGNLWFCADRPERSEAGARSLPTSEKDGIYGKDPRFEDPAKGDFGVPAGSAAFGRGPRVRS